MNNRFLQQEPEYQHPPKYTSYVHALLDKYEQMLSQHRLENPDLYRMVEQKAILLDDIHEIKDVSLLPLTAQAEDKISVSHPSESIYFKQSKQDQLKSKIIATQKLIHEQHVATHSIIIPRTQAQNVKQSYDSIESTTADRADKLEGQIKAWRSILPILIKRFAKIHDPRRAKSVKHKLVIILLYGLFAFIFRLSSRREMNRELTGTVIFENLKKLFPELESMPHVDTLARVLEKINVNDIERTHIELINQLIRNKKFKKLLISGCLPVALDGTQKFYQTRELHDLRWLSRQVGNK